MRARWIIACTLAEAAGIAGVSLAYAGSARGFAPEVPAILAGGAWEGLCLGTAQALVLRQAGVRAAPWVLVTVAMAALGYAGSLGFGRDADPAAAAPPLWLILPGAAAIGAGMGLLMGAAQWFAARDILVAWQWITANVVGWMPAMVAIFLPATQVTMETPLAMIALYGGLAGATAGFCVGLATSFALPET